VIVVDTGPIVALLNDRDDHHARCRDFLATHPGPLLVPTTVFTEVCMLVERRRGTRAELAFLTDIRNGLFTLLDTCVANQHPRQSPKIPTQEPTDVYPPVFRRLLPLPQFAQTRTEASMLECSNRHGIVLLQRL